MAKKKVALYQTETPEVKIAQVNAAWLRKVTGELGETEKRATVDETQDFTRSILRQESFFREILVPQLIREDQLDKATETDQPRKIIERESPDSFATWVPFQGTGPQKFYKGLRYEVRFGKIESPHFWKDKYSLMSYSVDIRKILADNAVRDMSDQEDTAGLFAVNAILAGRPTQVVKAPSFSATHFVNVIKRHLKRRQPLGKLLMTQALHQEAITLPAAAISNEIAAKHYLKGVTEEDTLFGLPVVETIKSWILDDEAGGRQSFYLFSPDNWVGKFFVLQDATLFIEQRGPNIHFYLYSSIGIALGNDRSFTRGDLPPSP